MITSTQDQALPLTQLPARASEPSQTPAPWLDALRHAAAARFAEVGLPSRRDEDWRHTSLKPLKEAAFRLPAAGPARDADVESVALPLTTGPRLVFVDGRYAPALSSPERAPAGVTVMPLAEAVTAREDLVRTHLAQHATIEHDPFTTLNTACLDDGAVVHVPRDVDAGEPVYVLSVTTTGEPLAVHPRLLVITEESSRLTIVEDYVSLKDGAFLTNAVTEIVVGAHGRVDHYLIERESVQAYNISTLKVEQQHDSHFASHSALLGGAIVRNNVHPVLEGENCHSLLNGLYIGSGSQHIDNHMRVEHAQPNCDSRQHYRGILQGESRGVFTGRIVVRRGAQKTDAIQQNQNLLLSEGAHAHTKPQLEIYADDVRCTHGATIGELDEEALFYLRSRGLSQTEARGMLVYAFASDSLDRMELVPVRDALRHMLGEQLRAHGVDRLIAFAETE